MELASRIVGIDPSQKHTAALLTAGFEAFTGTAQAVADLPEVSGAADVITMTWNLENSNDCNQVIDSCRALLKPGGALVVATGSHLLVPFKKPLNDYFSPNKNPDTHSFRWSRRSLGNLPGKHGFDIQYENHWHDSDWMVSIARNSGATPTDWSIGKADCDDPDDVLLFFAKWHAHSEWIASRWTFSPRLRASRRCFTNRQFSSLLNCQGRPPPTSILHQAPTAWLQVRHKTIKQLCP